MGGSDERGVIPLDPSACESAQPLSLIAHMSHHDK